MKWNRAVPEKLFLAGHDSSKAVFLHAMWLAVARGCMNNDDEASDMCLTYINEARKADGKRPISREVIAICVEAREAARAKIELEKTP